jgi:hypothetical protein
LALYKYLIREAQDLEILQVKKRLEMPSAPADNLKEAIREEDYPEFLRKEEEKVQREAQNLIDHENERKIKDREEAERLVTEEHSNNLKAKVGKKKIC